ncbi:MAG: RNase adapter RapZ [Acidobacteriota bacterium]
MAERRVHIVVVTGLSGSGKSTAIKAFEDLDYFCIDNLPVPMLADFLALCEKDMPDVGRIALGIDIRERSFLKDYDKIFNDLERSGYRFEIIFLEAATDILQRRYSQTRRVHPAASIDSSLLDAIGDEREQLKALRVRATRIVDTGTMSVHQLKAMITRTYSMVRDKDLLTVQVISFGFKHGLPFDADLVMDVRFLPNPYFIEDLKHLDGRTAEIGDWVLKWPVSREFVSDYGSLILKLLPAYVEEGKRYLTIAIGCTGGKHRSVVIADRLAETIRQHDYYVNVFHRDIHLE